MDKPDDSKKPNLPKICNTTSNDAICDVNEMDEMDEIDDVDDVDDVDRVSSPLMSNVLQFDKLEKLRRLESHLGLSTNPNNDSKHGVITPITQVCRGLHPNSLKPSYVEYHSVNIDQHKLHSPKMNDEQKTTYNIKKIAPISNELVKKNTHLLNNVCESKRINFIDLEGGIAAKTEELEFRRKTFWKSCCGVIDKRAFQYIIQVVIGFVVFIFCMYRVSVAPPRFCDSEDNTTVYIAIITSIIGWFLPSPQFN